MLEEGVLSGRITEEVADRISNDNGEATRVGSFSTDTGTNTLVNDVTDIYDIDVEGGTVSLTSDDGSITNFTFDSTTDSWISDQDSSVSYSSYDIVYNVGQGTFGNNVVVSGSDNVATPSTGELLKVANAIADEASLRSGADNALDSRLDTVEGTGVGSIIKAVVDEATRVDGLLGSGFTSTQTVAKTITDETSRVDGLLGSGFTSTQTVAKTIADESAARITADTGVAGVAAHALTLDNVYSYLGKNYVKDVSNPNSYYHRYREIDSNGNVVSGGGTYTISAAEGDAAAGHGVIGSVTFQVATVYGSGSEGVRVNTDAIADETDRVNGLLGSGFDTTETVAKTIADETSRVGSFGSSPSVVSNVVSNNEAAVISAASEGAILDVTFSGVSKNFVFTNGSWVNQDSGSTEVLTSAELAEYIDGDGNQDYWPGATLTLQGSASGEFALVGAAIDAEEARALEAERLLGVDIQDEADRVNGLLGGDFSTTDVATTIQEAITSAEGVSTLEQNEINAAEARAIASAEGVSLAEQNEINAAEARAIASAEGVSLSEQNEINAAEARAIASAEGVSLAEQNEINAAVKVEADRAIAAEATIVETANTDRGALTSESGTRLSADNALGGRITTETTRVGSFDANGAGSGEFAKVKTALDAIQGSGAGSFMAGDAALLGEAGVDGDTILGNKKAIADETDRVGFFDDLGTSIGEFFGVDEAIDSVRATADAAQTADEVDTAIGNATATDLSTSVQDSLTKADSALQSDNVSHTSNSLTVDGHTLTDTNTQLSSTQVEGFASVQRALDITTAINNVDQESTVVTSTANSLKLLNRQLLSY